MLKEFKTNFSMALDILSRLDFSGNDRVSTEDKRFNFLGRAGSAVTIHSRKRKAREERKAPR